jgi:hypothetical protein
MEERSLEFHQLSWNDPAGRLLWRDGNLYRGIREQRAGLYRDLFARGVIQGLVEKRLLIDSWPADFITPEFPLVLQHRVLPVVSFASEWCASQLQAAALMILELEGTLRRDSLTLLDINPWNVLFDGARPVFVDFSSIAPLQNHALWDARNEFKQFYLNPLSLFRNGLTRVARRLLFDPWIGIDDRDLMKMRMGGSRCVYSERIARLAKTTGRLVMPSRLGKAVKYGARKVRQQLQVMNPFADVPAELVGLERHIRGLSILGPKTTWSGYYARNFPPLNPPQDWTAKHYAIADALEQTKPKTLLDVGANRGWYSRLAANRGVRVIAADSDETAVSELYRDIREDDLPISSVFMDVRFPEPAQGPAYKFFPPATVRFRSEMVLALALVHHLTFTWHLSFDQIVDSLDAFSSKWLVVEFIGPRDGAVTRLWGHKKRPWYHEENFVRSVRRSYDIEREYASDSGGLDAGLNLGPDDRKIFLCRKQNL